MITRLCNIVTGTYARWNATNNVVFTELWNRTSRLNPRMTPIFKQLLLASYTCLSKLIGPDRTLRLNHSRGDLKRLSTDHFLAAYTILLAYYAALLPPHFRGREDEFDREFELLIGSCGLLDRYRASVADPAGFDLARTAGLAATDLACGLAPLALHDGIGLVIFDYTFATLSAAIYETTVKNLRAASA